MKTLNRFICMYVCIAYTRAQIPNAVKFTFDTRSGDRTLGPDGSVAYSPAMDSRLGTTQISSGTLTVSGYTIPRGIQVWTVGTAGTYKIVAAGARGGYARSTLVNNNRPGLGAVISTTIRLNTGDVVMIAVGTQGYDSDSGPTLLNTGGGGTFISKFLKTRPFNEGPGHYPILIAGGGGSQGTNALHGLNCPDPHMTTAGTRSLYCIVNSYDAGGCQEANNGNGGLSGTSSDDYNCGAGGGGFYGNGGACVSTRSGYEGSWYGGNSFLNGAAGGSFTSSYTGVSGSFGCGGSDGFGASGGGGFSGGKGGESRNTPRGAGSGGCYDHRGTDNTATQYSTWNQDLNGPAPSTYASGLNTGHGFVIVSACFNTFSVVGETCACESGYYLSSSTCLACAMGKYGTGQAKTSESSACLTCPLNTNSVQGSDSINMCTANAGYYQASSGTQGLACATCTSTQYASPDCTASNDRVCINCICSPNTYMSSGCTGTTPPTCTGCPLNTNSPGGTTPAQSSCTANAGFYQASAGTIGLACTTCTSLEYETRACTTTQDRTCAPYTSAAYMTFKLDTRGGHHMRGPDGTNMYSTPMESKMGSIQISDGSLSINSKIIPRGIQVWTVGSTNLYSLVAGGGRGGLQVTNEGIPGAGAVVSTIVNLNAGDIITCLIGHQGGFGRGGGGGGATFITKYSTTGNFNVKSSHTLLLVAGAGGGAAQFMYGASQQLSHGLNANFATSGTNARDCSTTVATGGSGGAGGGDTTCNNGGSNCGNPPAYVNYAAGFLGSPSGGGGFCGNGQNGSEFVCTWGVCGHNYAGFSFLNGGKGGNGTNQDGQGLENTPGSWGGNGSFGGGGGAYYGGGGGGGYSGGQGQTYGLNKGGGGGGSYDHFNSATNFDAEQYSTWNSAVFHSPPSTYNAGFNLGDGFIHIGVCGIDRYAVVTSKVVVCADCVKCTGAGIYKAGCTGVSPGTCQACGSCASGKYRIKCADFDEGICVDCPACSDTQYRAGCSGLSQGACQACGSCPSSQYRMDCNGTNPGTCTGCRLCPIGAYQSGGCYDTINTQCSGCPINTTSVQGSTSSAACTANAGYYVPFPGQSAVICSENHYCPTGSTAPVQCRNNTISAKGQSIASACTAKPGYYQTSVGGTAIICEPNFYCTGNTNRVQCPANTNSTEGSASLTACLAPPGYYQLSVGATSFPCEIGWYCEGSILRMQCQEKTTSLPKSSSYKHCLSIPGYYQAVEGSTPIICPSGFYCPGGIEKAPCPPFSSSDLGASNILSCLPGNGYYKINSTSTVLLPCDSGFYCSGNGSRTQCPTNTISDMYSTNISDCFSKAGYYGPNGMAAAPCPQNSYCPQASASPVPCPTNTISKSLSSSAYNCTANAGFFGKPGSIAAACPTGFFSSPQSESATSCMGCVPLAGSAMSSSFSTQGQMYGPISGFRVHQFKEATYSITFVQNILADVLLVGGGGWGGDNVGGGGGAGAILFYANYLFRSSTTYTFKVASNASASSISNGSTIIFEAKAGGRGGNINTVGSTGASGGGGGGGCTAFGLGGSTNTNTMAKITGYTVGFKGGQGFKNNDCQYAAAGGGGGAGAIGSPASNDRKGGIGGMGVDSVLWSGKQHKIADLFGEAYTSIATQDKGNYYIGGGGGGGANAASGCETAGGLGGGGTGMNCGSGTDASTAGTPNTGSGGGGGGANSQLGKSGGSGLILIRYSMCQPCPTGTYLTNAGPQGVCSSCPSGKNSGWGAVGCNDCPLGYV